MISAPSALMNFTAVVKIAGINPYVDVPPRVVETLGRGANVPVRVKVTRAGTTRKKAPAGPKAKRIARDSGRLRAIARLGPGDWFRTTVVPSRSGASRLYLDMWMREMAGAGVGDRVRVTVKADRAPRALRVPRALSQALEANPKARAAWDGLAPSHRREMLSYLNFLKTPAALERNVQKVVARLLDET